MNGDGITRGVSVLSFPEPPLDKDEILRYAGAGEGPDVGKLLDGVLDDLLPGLVYRVCFAETSVETDGENVFFGFSRARSRSLSRRLADCGSAVVFAATVGFEPDILSRAERFDPLRALLVHAAGAERVEALCDAFCSKLGDGYEQRFSPGYGDLPLSFQREIFDFLNPGKNIGIVLSEKMIMSPSKSVTAIVGKRRNSKNG